MPTRHKVKEGDCVSSIAFEYGFAPKTLWKHLDNAELKQERKNPNVPAPGDILFIPDKRRKVVEKPSEQKHRFRRKGVPEVLKVRFLDKDDTPRANIPYRIEVDGHLKRGETNDDGYLIESIAPDAKLAKVFLSKLVEERHEFNLGRLPPITTTEGVQARLKNLGNYQGDITGKDNSALRKAVRAFQDDHDIDAPKGKDQAPNEIDQATREAIKSHHLS